MSHKRKEKEPMELPKAKKDKEEDEDLSEEEDDEDIIDDIENVKKTIGTLEELKEQVQPSIELKERAKIALKNYGDTFSEETQKVLTNRLIILPEVNYMNMDLIAASLYLYHKRDIEDITRFEKNNIDHVIEVLLNTRTAYTRGKTTTFSENEKKRIYNDIIRYFYWLNQQVSKNRIIA